MNNDKRDGRIGVNFTLSVIGTVLGIINLALILLLWNSGPQDIDVNVLAISITALEVVLGILAVLLGIGAFAGFWMIRTSAVEAAREEARRKVDELAPVLIEQARRATEGGSGKMESSNSNEPKVDITALEESKVVKKAKKVGDDNQ